MRLKRLTLHGFKTFADKTVVEFVPGVTAIVGPNGSGKSNILDAVTWVLGEQKASSLRATRAADVIFAGSARRKPMGMAEVSLTVDNEDGFLPLQFSEVTITRRIYRSGEGEYFINKAPCRLRDITDLFLDTGVGRGAYAIVNQSEIDAILSARPEDRRALFEEAAGIKKYRVKKQEAQRKLESTEQNLTRLYDIARELEGSLAPLEAQAITARRYQELTDRLREVEVGQLAADYKRHSDELDELRRQAADFEREAATMHAEAERLEASAQELGNRVAEAESEMDTARLLQQRAMAEAERIEGRIALSAERRASARRTVETVEQDLARLAEEKARFSAEAEAQTAAAREAEAQADAQARELAEAETLARNVTQALAELSRRVAGQEADYLELARRLAGQKVEWEAVRVRIAQRGEEVREIEERTSLRRTEAEKARTDATTLADAVNETKAALAEARRVLTEEREPARQTAVERVGRLAEMRTTADRVVAGQAARLRTLEETEAAQEGYFQGVRSVARAAQNGKLTGRYRLVADALRVPAHLDTAIEIALGASLQDIITDSEAEAKAAIRFLNETRGGRATFLPLDALRHQEVPESLQKAAKQYQGVLGSAADLVGHDTEVAPAVRVLLARVLIVQDLDTATFVSKRLTRDWAKIVTLNGEVVVPTGAITGGTQGKPGPNLLGRKREIAELTEAVQQGRAEIERLHIEEARAKEVAETTRQAVREGEAAVNRAREAVGDSERKYAAKLAEAERLERDTESLEQRSQKLRDGGAADQAREAELAAAIASSDRQDEGAQATREELQQRQAALAVQRDEAQQQVRERGAHLALLRERVRSLNRDAERAKESALRATVESENRQQRAQEAQEIIATEEAEETTRLAEREHIKRNLADTVGRFEKWKERRQNLLNENFQLTERIKGANRAEQRATEQIQQAKLRMARVEAQWEAVGQRLIAEYELDPEIAVAQTGGAPVDRDTAQKIGRLRREIRSLGAVNTGAIEEYERVSERWRFLSEQRRDLEEARTRLLKAIAEIDDATRGVFEETFAAVSKAFSRLFLRLFSGGSTELTLTNPDDLWETGIEIWAQPPGKKRQSLSLLSGGERALTATALLFAFLEVRPAPFCFLDEVDAPLDGANVEKFADLVREFGQESQFIMITHNATTMEAAPLWYGVTMQEPGVSRGISMKVPDSPAGSIR
ncbi:MAG: chromosome segregation protein SMC [Armatimonadaceae bacterium]